MWALLLNIALAMPRFQAPEVTPEDWWTHPEPCPTGAVLVGAPWPDGQQISCQSSLSGRAHGMFTEWDAEGRRVRQGAHADGKKVGRWHLFLHDDGKQCLRRYVLRYAWGIRPAAGVRARLTGEAPLSVLHGRAACWSADGWAYTERSFHGQPVGWERTWHPSGRVTTMHSRLDGLRRGWYADGQRYVRSTLWGVRFRWVSWHEDGQRALVTIDTLDGEGIRWRTWDAAGQPLDRGAVRPSSSRTVTWSPDGTKTVERCDRGGACRAVSRRPRG